MSIKSFLAAAAIVGLSVSGAAAGSILGAEEEQEVIIPEAQGTGLSPAVGIAIGVLALAAIASDSSNGTAGTP